MNIWSRLRGWWAHRRCLREARKSIGPLMTRADDRLLEDIGLTRQDVRNIIERWDN